MTKTIDWYARSYTKNFGFHLVPIEPKRKFPRATDWGNKCISDPEEAASFYEKHPDWNLGIALGPSKMCALDIDDLESFKLICEVYGIDLGTLIEDTPTIHGKGFRLEFRVPDGMDLPYRKLNWPTEADKTKRFTVFELRSATDGSAKQNVYPPSIHPDTGEPYKWITQPRLDWPTPPEWLLAMWTNFDSFKPQMAAMCPWAELPPAPKPKSPPLRPVFNDGSGTVIEKFIASQSLTDSLSRYGYSEVGKRWLSPHSSTKLPGVVVFEDHLSCWIHHASDPLCSDESGRPVNAFDLYAYYEHGGDVSKAVKSAASLLGIQSKPMQPVAAIAAPAQSPAPTSTPAVTRDTVTPLPWTTSKGKPLKHIDNLRAICARLGVTIRYNVISKEEEILIPHKSFSLDNAANASYAWLTSECSLFDFPTDKMGEFLTYLSDQNLYNPVAQWITSKPWDGQPRLNELFATVTARNELTNPDTKSLKETLIKRWMVSAVAAAFSPTGVSAHGVLVFQGDQYLGKTKWFKTLIPPDLGLLKDGMLLRPDDKDSVKQICSYWLVELGELDSTFRKSDIAALKAFITNDSDVLRRAYARKESKFARRTVFFGSVNPREFLHDPTGNRRYWTIECERLDHSHTLDMQQVWAEVYALYQAGEGYYLTPEEMDQLNGHNQEFTSIDPVEERIQSGLDWDLPESLWRWDQVTALLVDSGFDRPTRGDVSAAANIIRKLNKGQSKTIKGKRLLFAPPKRM